MPLYLLLNDTILFSMWRDGEGLHFVECRLVFVVLLRGTVCTVEVYAVYISLFVIEVFKICNGYRGLS